MHLTSYTLQVKLKAVNLFKQSTTCTLCIQLEK